MSCPPNTFANLRPFFLPGFVAPPYVGPATLRRRALPGRKNASQLKQSYLRDTTLAKKLVIAGLVFLPAGVMGQETGDEDELAGLLSRIESVEQGLGRDQAAQSEAQADLRDAETELMRLREAADQVERQLADSRSRQSRLEDELLQSGQQRQRAQRALATAMRRSWRSGRQGDLKALLSGESAGDVDRRLVWSGLLTRSWANRASESARVAGEILKLSGESRDVEQKLADLQARRAEQILQLERAAGRRKEVLKGLRLRIGEAGEEVQRLKARTATLASLVDDLGRIVEDHPALPLPSITAARGQLQWPVSGRVLQRFGAGPGGGQASWDGILLEADAGAPVHAPHPGRVVFADWVRGLGFLMVLDHGENVLSLFAYNERLLGRKGEMVIKGQVIAHAGSTGGRREPGLYFEIRQNGKPVDPVRWLSR